MGKRKLTTEEFIKKSKLKHGETYDYSKTIFTGIHNKVTIICRTHDEFEQSANSHQRGFGCGKCSGRYKNTNHEFVMKANIVHNERYGYLKSDYINCDTKVIITCSNHGDFLQTPDSHLRGSGCPSCGGTKKSTTEEFIVKANEIHRNYYDYSKVEYISQYVNVMIICNTHGDFLQKPSIHLGGYGCSKCSGMYQPTTEEFITKAQIKHNLKYDYSQTIYINAKTKITIICKKHGKFEQTPNDHLNGRGCAKCLEWKGERRIRQILEKHGIKFESQYRIDSCKNVNPLPFDFYVVKNNLLIEFQGVQHYKIIKKFGGEEAFKQRQSHDKIKREFALSNGYNFLEITYLDFDNIEKILKDALGYTRNS